LDASGPLDASGHLNDEGGPSGGATRTFGVMIFINP
jgi:hypothetical protein